MSHASTAVSGQRAPFSLIAFGLGVAFAVGLSLGGMTSPDRIVNYLDFSGSWDPTLLFVMGGAVPVYALTFPLIRRRKHPVCASAFQIPSRRDVDSRLLIGSALFGLGWGLGGICPGPALVSIASGATEIWVFVAAMLAGIQLANVYDALQGRALATARSRS